MNKKLNKGLVGVMAVAMSTAIIIPAVTVMAANTTTGWAKDGSKWCYLNVDGSKKTGWLSCGPIWYFLNANGAMEKSWVKDGQSWYYLNAGGDMRTGWLSCGSIWYFLNASGTMAKGWINDGGKWYYLNDGGDMAVNKIVDGWQLDDNGVGKKIPVTPSVTPPIVITPVITPPVVTPPVVTPGGGKSTGGGSEHDSNHSASDHSGSKDSTVTTAGAIAAGITKIAAPAENATKLILPKVAAGYTVAIKTTNTPGVIALDGTIQPKNVDTKVSLVLEVTKTSDSTTASSISIDVLVAADITAPKTTITDATYNTTTNTIKLTGKDFTTAAAETTDIKTLVDWTKVLVSVTDETPTTTTFSAIKLDDITSAVITSDTTLTIILTDAEANILETAGLNKLTEKDTITITAGFIKDAAKNAATTDELVANEL